MKDTVLTVLYGVALFFCILTFSIAVPIYARGFYYAQIEPLNLPAETGYSVAEIREAYDAVLDYLTLPAKPFSTGVFRHSAAGAAHFKDCKALFTANAITLLVSAGICGALWVLERRGKLRLKRPFGMHVGVVPSALIVTGMLGIGTALIVDFDGVFAWFHSVCFPGKDNWLFSYVKDPIIRILPETFFMRCAWLIVAVMAGICLAIIAAQLLHIRKKCK